MSNILVTGSDGQLGSALKKASKNSDHNWFFTNRSKLDITNQASINTFIEENNINVIINCAAYTAVDKAETESDLCYLVNKIAVKYLAVACAKNKCILIHISTDYVYNPNHNEAVTEQEALNPDGAYAQSKYEGELAALDHNPKTIVIRTSWVYDEQGKNFVNTMLRLGDSKKELYVVNDQIGSPSYAKDIAEAIIKIISKLTSSPTKKYYGIYNFSNDGFISWYEFAKEIMRIANLDCEIHPIPSSEYPTPASRPLNSRMDKSKIVKTFDINLRNWKDSLKECIANKSYQ